MTVCIAAIGQWANISIDPPRLEPIVVLASDRMITFSGTEFEMLDQTKEFHLSEKVTVLVSGNHQRMLEICLATLDRVKDETALRVKAAALTLASEFQAYRRRRNEQRVLEPFGLAYDSFIDRQAAMAPEFFRRLLNDLDGRDADVGAQAIVAGIDDTGPHIYVVNEPGKETSFDALGFAAIGVGSSHAESVFVGAQYTGKRDWTDAVLLTYLAKKRAQVAPGVGEHTDFYYILDSGRTYFEPSNPFQQQLAAVYQARREKELQALAEDRELLVKLFAESDSAPDDASKEGSGSQTTTADHA